MKAKQTLFPLALILAVFALTSVIAADIASDVSVYFKDLHLQTSYNNTVGYVGETVPVRVVFRAATDAKDARIRVWLGGSEEISASTRRLSLIKDLVYTEILNLRLPSRLETTNEPYTLRVTIEDSVNETIRTYPIWIQREAYELRVLSVDSNQIVEAGNVLPVMVVVKNTGFEDAEDVYVTVSIPEIGAYAKAYLSDLVAVECQNINCDRDDATSKVLNLQVPENARAGVYEMIITVYNYDSRKVEKRLVEVRAPKSTLTLLSTVSSQDIAIGETKNYELVLVNAEDRIKVFQITTSSDSALEVSAPSVVTVGPQTAQTVKISVRAKDRAEEGRYVFSVNVDGKQTTYTANVTRTSGLSNRWALALTVVLVVIFVALLVVLLVLLFKRDEKKVEEIETSYY
ncbi:MAG: hypothetical protein QXX68_00025 [Candidatus Pacearchaeota archaeon]